MADITGRPNTPADRASDAKAAVLQQLHTSSIKAAQVVKTARVVKKMFKSPSIAEAYTRR